MNMQQVTGGTLFAAKNRIAVLQQAVKDGQLSIEARNAAHDRRRGAALRENMKPSEFLALFPSPPTFAAEDAEIAAKQAQINVLNAGTGTNVMPQANLQRDIDMLGVQKGNKTAAYNRQLTKPERPLTVAEFATLYQAPTHSTDQSTITAAQTEANKLDSFLKSGPYPNPGLYDVDLLTGTQVSYP
jgi:hypothetical protein